MVTKKDVLHGIVMFLSELSATAIFLYLGCLGCVKSPNAQNNHLQTCVAFGITVLISVQCFGFISGSHINPAITLAKFIVYRGVSLPMAIVYCFGQLVGAVIGYGLLMASLPLNVIRSQFTPRGVCITTLSPDVAIWQGVLIEFLLTSALILVCCGIWDPRNVKWHDSVAVRFGLAVVCLALVGGSHTGASMNPVRSFAPAVWNNVWDYHWIYWVAPMAASVCMSFLYKYVFLPSADDSEDPPADQKA